MNQSRACRTLPSSATFSKTRMMASWTRRSGSFSSLSPTFTKPTGGSDDEFAAPGLLIAGRQGTLAQKIELVLVEAALQSQQQPVVALTRRIDRLLIDQHGIDNAAHLDQLLPVTAVAGETRDFPRPDRSDLAQADLGHHSIKAGARDTARPLAPEIVIHRFDAS